MRRVLSEQYLLLLVSLAIAVTSWYYVTTSFNPRAVHTKTVAVIPTIVGEPRYGYSLIGIRVLPPTITISGDSAKLESLRSVTTEPVDLAGETRDIIREVGLIGPPDIVRPGRVRVEVTIRPAFVATVVRGIRVRVENVPAGHVVQVEPDTVEVHIQGPLTIVSRLRANDFAAIVDAANFTEGRRRVQVEVKRPPEVEVLAVQPLTVTVVIRRGG